MKKTTILIVMAVLCLNFWARAQAIDVITKGLQIGQAVPDLILTNLHNYKDFSGKPATTAKLADFKGKLLILDFWATWCAPCVASIPKLEKLQQHFAGKLQILPITYQKEKEVVPFLKNLNKGPSLLNNLPYALAETQPHKLFPHVFLPHYVWIDENGIVIAITGLREVNDLEISSALNQDYKQLTKKQDYKINWDKDKPLFMNNNGGDGATRIYHSLLSPYILGIPSGFTIVPPIIGTEGFSKVVARNVSMAQMSRIALQSLHKKQFTESKCVYEIRDSINIIPDSMWSRRQQLAFTYELIPPPALQANAGQFMVDDLNRLFPQFKVAVEKRKTWCYALRKLPSREIVPSLGGEEEIIRESNFLEMRNGSVNLLINTLDHFYYSHSKIPIVNLVDDSKLTDLIINAPLSNPEAINLELTKYGLELVKGEFEIDMIVYRDSVK
ncbi:MAG: TlpA family protein disulfide reductase [Bacteroidia bacterium]